jgi:hypothetical protein
MGWCKRKAADKMSISGDVLESFAPVFSPRIWWLAMLAPDRVDRLVVVNAPHPDAFRRELMTPDQMLRSWYAAAFQVPVLPEAAFRANGFALLEHIFRTSSVKPGAYTDEDIRRYQEAAARPGAITAMLNYYRAAARFPHPPTDHHPPHAPRLGRAGPGADRPADGGAGRVGPRHPRGAHPRRQPLGARGGAGPAERAADRLSLLPLRA